MGDISRYSAKFEFVWADAANRRLFTLEELRQFVQSCEGIAGSAFVMVDKLEDSSMYVNRKTFGVIEVRGKLEDDGDPGLDDDSGVH